MMASRMIYLIKRAEIEMTSRLFIALEPFGLTPIQYSLLYFIDISERDLSSAQLSRRFSVTPQSMNELVMLLERKKLLKKTADPSHRRIFRISLTKKGRQLLENSSHELDTLEENLLKDLTKKEITLLRSLIGRISEPAREKAIS
jgi:DNA-binding MarR family transcriptional regulator